MTQPYKAAAEGSAPPPTGVGGKPMTPAERARHAALVRWKKENPIAANVAERLAQIRAARLAKGKKKGKGGKGKAKGGAGKKPKAAAKPKQTPEQRKQAKQQEQAAAREVTLKGAGVGEDARASLDDLAAGRDVEDDGGLEKMGLAEKGKDGKLRLTSAGRAVHRAAGRGDAGGVKDAISRAKDKASTPKATPKSGGGDAQRQKKKERAKKQAERKAKREKAIADRQAKEQERRANADTAGRIAARQKVENANARAKERDAQMNARTSSTRPAASRQGQRKPGYGGYTGAQMERKTMDDIEFILDELIEIKAGRRNSGNDQAQIDRGYELAMDLCDLFETLGADTGEEDDEAPDAESEGMEGKADIAYGVDGDAVKSLADGQIGAYAVRFGDESTPDMSQMRDYFTKATDFWLDAWDRRPMLYHHAMDEDTQDAPRIGTWTKAEVKDEGVWLEGQLDRSHRYYTAIKELIRRGALRLSSDSAPHLVRREAKGHTHEVTRWPLLAASLTPTPAEPRLTAVTFKALIAELGIDDRPSTPEADDTDERERQDAAKAIEVRQRRALMELDLLTLETS